MSHFIVVFSGLCGAALLLAGMAVLRWDVEAAVTAMTSAALSAVVVRHLLRTRRAA